MRYSRLQPHSLHSENVQLDHKKLALHYCLTETRAQSRGVVFVHFRNSFRWKEGFLAKVINIKSECLYVFGLSSIQSDAGLP